MATDKMTPAQDAPGPSFSTEQAVALRGETAALAQAEQAKAQVQARYLMAMKNPRDWDTVRIKLQKECRRPSAAEVFRYHKPIGKGVEGMSIRFAEAAVRCMTNILVESHVVYDDTEKRQIRVSVTDLEGNVTYPIDVMVAKTVERRTLKPGEVALSVRINSQNQPTYTLPATDDDVLNKSNAQVSKAIRTAALRILPGDIQDECETIILETLQQRDAADPDAAKKKILDAFAGLNVMPAEIKVYIGHPVEQLNPKEIQELRALYTAIKEGEATWAAALESKTVDKPKAAAEEGPKQSALDKLAGKPAEETRIAFVKPAEATLQMRYDESVKVPACAGCGCNVPAPSASDAEGRAWHAECLAVLKKK
jgi:hypothetical protein